MTNAEGINSPIRSRLTCGNDGYGNPFGKAPKRGIDRFDRQGQKGDRRRCQRQGQGSIRSGA